MTARKRKCPVCAKGFVTPVASRAPMPFRHMPALVPAWEVRVPTCDHCHEQFINAATARALDTALEAALQAHQTRLVEQSIARLGTVRTQREWEKRLGLSPGYLSRLKTGKESSVVLTTLLALIARAPARMWAQVEAIWSGADESSSVAVAFGHDDKSVSKTLHVQLEGAAQTTPISTLRFSDAQSSSADYCVEAA